MANQQQGGGQGDILDSRTCGWCGEEMTYPPRFCRDSQELCAACGACLCDEECDCPLTNA
ncbi:hypothetical protein ACFC1R_37990 [Kitasatospora sp. NPDC056138]|uniref:hypothetical protein n=1 Tax=Kitasatospora sp. NPDC056138 TaxID=3345724 RepID=UPI0035D7D624